MPGNGTRDRPGAGAARNLTAVGPVLRGPYRIRAGAPHWLPLPRRRWVAGLSTPYERDQAVAKVMAAR
ncbi:hypothetical protein GCM10010300_52360 [Streptomyces olivaceoviridis]|nr:hypothetical protein GCM10010300_52360 [Streptomyces olivaceoviridis]